MYVNYFVSLIFYLMCTILDIYVLEIVYQELVLLLSINFGYNFSINEHSVSVLVCILFILSFVVSNSKHYLFIYLVL